jgi:hypothetical protein
MDTNIVWDVRPRLCTSNDKGVILEPHTQMNDPSPSPMYVVHTKTLRDFDIFIFNIYKTIYGQLLF